MDKKKLGNNIYYASIIISVVVLLLILFIYQSEDNEKLSITRYFACYFCFGAIIPTGLLIREFLIEQYIKKKMIYKIITIIFMIIIGIIGYIFIKSAAFGLIMFFLSLLALMYIAVPTIPKDK